MATIEHCLYCFETLTAHLENREPLTLEQVQTSYRTYLQATTTTTTSSSPPTTTTTTSTLIPNFSSHPLFITWNITSTRAPTSPPHLRGCIGTFSPLPLSDGLSSYALTSALHDTRFSPISASELPRLSVAVTLLTDFEDAKDDEDWELGKHGLRISFAPKKSGVGRLAGGRRYSATYLPDVAVEQGWDKEETLVSLMQKAGWRGEVEGGKWREAVEMKVVRYQGKKTGCEFGEFKAWRDWVGKERK